MSTTNWVITQGHGGHRGEISPCLRVEKIRRVSTVSTTNWMLTQGHREHRDEISPCPLCPRVKIYWDLKPDFQQGEVIEL